MDFGIYNRDSNVRRYEIKDLNGKTVGSYTIRKKEQKAKKKNVKYDYRELSSRILRASTPYSAGQAAAAARVKIAVLGRQLYSGVYDDKELKDAIMHARRMERAAKKRLNNLQEEELKQKHQKNLEREEKIRKKQREGSGKKTVKKDGKELSESEIRSMLIQIQESLRTIEADSKSSEKMEIEKDAPASKAMPGNRLKKRKESAWAKDDLERKRKKHRIEEFQDIMRADMEYLRTKLARMERNQEACASMGNSCEGGDGIGGGGVSLELGGVDISVPAPEMPVPCEGGSVDVSV